MWVIFIENLERVLKLSSRALIGHLGTTFSFNLTHRITYLLTTIMFSFRNLQFLNLYHTRVKKILCIIFLLHPCRGCNHDWWCIFGLVGKKVVVEVKLVAFVVKTSGNLSGVLANLLLFLSYRNLLIRIILFYFSIHITKIFPHFILPTHLLFTSL